MKIRFPMLFDSKGQDEEHPIISFFVFILLWAFGTLLFLSVFIFAGYLFARFIFN